MATRRAMRAFCSSASGAFCPSARAELSGFIAYAPMQTEGGHSATSLGVALPTGHMDWYFLEFPQAMAPQLQKGDVVRVAGPLKLLTLRHQDEKELYTVVKMEVAELKKASSLEPQEKKMLPLLPAMPAQAVASTSNNSKAAKRASMLKLWDDFFSDPSGWLDLRKIKKSEKSPDFKKFVGNDAIWIESFLLLPEDCEAIKEKLRQIGKL